MKPINYIDWQRHYASVLALVFTLLVVGSFAQSKNVNAENLSPSQVVKAAISDLLNDIRSNESLYQKEPAKLDQLIREKVILHFDFLRMTQLAMASHWNTTTMLQRSDVANAFQDLFIATYGKQLFDYRNTNADIEMLPGGTDQKASLKLKASNQRGDKVTLVLRLEKGTDQWEIIDVNVDGVSYIVTMRGQFSESLSQKGVDGLIIFLKEAAQQK